MRAVDLAVFADLLAARASALGAESIGLLAPPDSRGRREEIARLAADLAAVEELQAWVEERLFEARAELDGDGGDPGGSPRYRGARATRSPPSSS